MRWLAALLVVATAAALGGATRSDDLTYVFAGELTRGLGIKIDRFEPGKGQRRCIDITRHKDEFSERLEAASRSRATVKTVVIKTFASPFTGVQDTLNEVRIVNYAATADIETFSLVFGNDSWGVWSDESRPPPNASPVPVDAISPHHR